MITETMLPESYARTLSICPGCGKPKQIGCVVCWDCFKYRTDIKPLKYFDGSLADWLNKYKIGLLVPVGS